MFDLLLITSLITNCIQGIKTATTPTIPAENWANRELYNKDLMSGMDGKQLMKNVENGKYKLTEKYPEPHRNPKTGKIIIENCKLWREDVKNYGAWQAEQWVKQGKYNLTPEELEKQYEEYEKKWNIKK